MRHDVRATKVLALVAALSFGCGQVSAEIGTIKVQSGTVMVNHGQGFRAVTGEERVSAGDMVMVQPASIVNLVYDANPCAIPLGAEQVTVVNAEAQCAANASTPASDAPAGAESSATGLSASQIGLGALAIAGVAGLAIAASSSSKKAASP